LGAQLLSVPATPLWMAASAVTTGRSTVTGKTRRGSPSHAGSSVTATSRVPESEVAGARVMVTGPERTTEAGSGLLSRAVGSWMRYSVWMMPWGLPSSAYVVTGRVTRMTLGASCTSAARGSGARLKVKGPASPGPCSVTRASRPERVGSNEKSVLETTVRGVAVGAGVALSVGLSVGTDVGLSVLVVVGLSVALACAATVAVLATVALSVAMVVGVAATVPVATSVAGTVPVAATVAIIVAVATSVAVGVDVAPSSPDGRQLDSSNTMGHGQLTPLRGQGKMGHLPRIWCVTVEPGSGPTMGIVGVTVVVAVVVPPAALVAVAVPGAPPAEVAVDVTVVVPVTVAVDVAVVVPVIVVTDVAVAVPIVLVTVAVSVTVARVAVLVVLVTVAVPVAVVAGVSVAAGDRVLRPTVAVVTATAS